MEAPRSVFPLWVHKLSMQQQTVLMLASRGPDGIPKFHPCKDVTRAYRGTVFAAAYFGRFLEWGEKADTFMSLDRIADPHTWHTTMVNYFDAVDSIPHHYHMHLTHGAQILGYKHPHPGQAARWNGFYRRSVRDAHMNVETEQEMDERLCDWNQEHWVDLGP